MKQWIDKADELLMHTYNRYKIVLDHGDGVYLYDIDGKKYLDFAAGIAVFALGYGHKGYNDALKGQVDKLLHTSNLYYSVPTVEAADKLVKATGLDQVFFTNSGTEAIEGALKLARKYYYKKHGKADSQIIAMHHSFHGRSMGALSVTGTQRYREPFEPLIGGAVFAQYNDLDSVKALINANTCGIILEPIQGEGGIHPATPEFIKGVRALCDEHGLVLILDEIQAGMGRTGDMFAYQGYGIKPDIITSAKALGCGVPVGAFVASKQVANAFEPGDHGTTYGGNPFAMAAISKVFDLFEEENILKHVKEIAPYLALKLEGLANSYECIKEHRGIGLMQGLEFTQPVGGVIQKALEKGLIIISAGTHILRFVPPLVINKENVDQMIEILEQCITEVMQDK